MNRTPLENERQYEITKMQKERLENSLHELKTCNRSKLSPILLQASINAYQSVIDDLQWEISDYEKRWRLDHETT